MIYVHIFNDNNYEISKIITHVQANDWDMLRTCSIQVDLVRTETYQITLMQAHITDKPYKQEILLTQASMGRKKYNHWLFT